MNGNLRARYPQLSLRDVPIAAAAESVGFDCSSWQNIKRLIDAVRQPENTIEYPDRWAGPAAYQSSIYPDKWSAEQERFAKGVSQAYKFGGFSKSVPSFVVPAPQILKNVHSFSKAARDRHIPMSKRAAESYIDLTHDDYKRPKLESSTPARYSQGIVDLTRQDSPPLKQPRPDSSLPRRPVLAKISNNARIPSSYYPKPTISKANQRQIYFRNRTLLSNHQRAQRARQDQTVAIFARVASRLHATAADIDADRGILRERWDVDDDLKTNAITDDLGELNETFTRIEDEIEHATGVIEKKLLRRR